MSTLRSLNGKKKHKKELEESKDFYERTNPKVKFPLTLNSNPQNSILISYGRLTMIFLASLIALVTR
jgi:hypothetical protein